MSGRCNEWHSPSDNRRDMLRDAYEEALDLAMYLRQKIEEERSR